MLIVVFSVFQLTDLSEFTCEINMGMSENMDSADVQACGMSMGGCCSITETKDSTTTSLSKTSNDGCSISCSCSISTSSFPKLVVLLPNQSSHDVQFGHDCDSQSTVLFYVSLSETSFSFYDKNNQITRDINGEDLPIYLEIEILRN